MSATSLTAVEARRLKIWIDLDNSPHVPFFAPLIEELKHRGYDVLLTARDNAQVLQLMEYHNLKCNHYGRHYGKYKPIKVLGLGIRALQMAPLILQEAPDLALSHGSRSQIILSSLLRIPSLAIVDYEHTKMNAGGIGPKWLMMPEIVAAGIAGPTKNRILEYPGIKEDVYVPRFRPMAGIREKFGVTEHELMVTIRPPASDAHYHSPESDELFRITVAYLGQIDKVRMIVLPRNKNQADLLRREWQYLFASGKFLIPDQVVDGLNLIWFSDLVISGGGTMNREAAALGVPVYSIFRGKQAAVDRYLASAGRLVLLKGVGDMKDIRLVRREPLSNPVFGERAALSRIVENVISTVESSSRPSRH